MPYPFKALATADVLLAMAGTSEEHLLTSTVWLTAR